MIFVALTTFNFMFSQDAPGNSDEEALSPQQHWVVVAGNNVVSVSTSEDGAFRVGDAALGDNNADAFAGLWCA